MKTNREQISDPIVEQAAEWFVENRAGLDSEQRREFAAWLKASPLHVKEYLALTALAKEIPAACQSADNSREQLLAEARREEGGTVHSLWPHPPIPGPALGRRGWQTLALAAALVLSIGLLTLQYWPTHQRPISGGAAGLRFHSGHGEQQTHGLADHSVIHLNTDTTVTVRFDSSERLVVLEAGEAYFEVAHEARRPPLRVFAGSAEVVDVGTKFDVRLGQSETLVTVTEGRVDVGLKPETGHTMNFLELSAGQQIRVAGSNWPARPVAVDVLHATAWLQRQIRFEDQPLAQVTSEFNRYAPTPIEITTPALRDLKISGVFATDDTEAFIAFLRSLQGVHVEVTATRIRVSQT